MNTCQFNATFRPSRASSGIQNFCLPDEARDGPEKNQALLMLPFLASS